MAPIDWTCLVQPIGAILIFGDKKCAETHCFNRIHMMLKRLRKKEIELFYFSNNAQ